MSPSTSPAEQSNEARHLRATAIVAAFFSVFALDGILVIGMSAARSQSMQLDAGPMELLSYVALLVQVLLLLGIVASSALESESGRVPCLGVTRGAQQSSHQAGRRDVRP